MADTKTAGSKSKFTPEERAAMKERAKEEKALKTREEGEKAVLAKIKEMTDDDRAIAEKVHELVSKTAPDLVPRTWYGMPAYSTPDGELVCFFRDAAKFKERYATFGFQPAAKLDQGSMWAKEFAITQWNTTVERELKALVKKAVS